MTGRDRHLPRCWKQRLHRKLSAYIVRALHFYPDLSFASGTPPTSLVAGTCRFGDDPATSVLDRDCRAHQVENLFITDGSFMPTGGSVPYTWTIYANAFRVADRILAQLGGRRERGRLYLSAVIHIDPLNV